jgi:pyrroloquinoline-quinone synthase
MTYIDRLTQELNPKNLLEHPFYKDYWSKGRLTRQHLACYAKQYFRHVDAFPRYVSAAHSNCDHLPTRQILLNNLIDEEQGTENHPELWLRFAEAVGQTRKSITEADVFEETEVLVKTFLSLAQSSYPEGLGALYAYERQIPEVAKTKIEGLKQFYDITDEHAIKFFKVHIEADEWHSQEAAMLLEQLSEDDQAKASDAARRAADALWNFLSAIQRETVDALH